jgi:hypothetical protein
LNLHAKPCWILALAGRREKREGDSTLARSRFREHAQNFAGPKLKLTSAIAGVAVPVAEKYAT